MRTENVFEVSVQVLEEDVLTPPWAKLFCRSMVIPLIFMSLLLLCYDTGSIATPIQKRLIQKLFKNIPEEAFCGLWILKIIKNSEKHSLIVPIIYSTRNSLVQIFALSHP